MIPVRTTPWYKFYNGDGEIKAIMMSLDGRDLYFSTIDCDTKRASTWLDRTISETEDLEQTWQETQEDFRATWEPKHKRVLEDGN